MTNDELKQALKDVKPISTDVVKSIAENAEKMVKSASAKLRAENISDIRDELLVDIAQNVNETKKNTKIPFWKTLVIAIIGSVFGGLATYLFTLVL